MVDNLNDAELVGSWNAMKLDGNGAQRNYQFKTFDGVFVKLNAGADTTLPSPKIIDIKKLDTLPTYDQVVKTKPPEYTEFSEFNHFINELGFEHIPLGSSLEFILSFVISAFCFLSGFIISYILSRSRAGHCGSISGFSFGMSWYFIKALISEFNAPVEDAQPLSNDLDILLFATVFFILLFIYYLALYIKLVMLSNPTDGNFHNIV